MKKFRVSRWLGLPVLGATGALLASSCNNPTAHNPAAAPQPTEIGRFQVVPSSEPGRGTVLFLVDTKDGTTWIYRGPQAKAFNGFCSNIPKLQVSDDYWREAMRELVAVPQREPGAAPATPPNTNPPPATTPPNSPPAPEPPKP